MSRLSLVLFTFSCASDDGLNVRAVDGEDGLAGAAGQHCWDLDGDGLLGAGEDRDGDGQATAQDCQGPAGAAGAEGLEGLEGAPGEDGLSCWDLDGDGAFSTAEDQDGDGAPTAADCRGADGASGGGGVTKDQIYTVTGTAGGSSSAPCADANDVLLHGGCTFNEGCAPAHFTFYSRAADDLSTAADYYCKLDCGSVTAHATCLSVP